MIQVYVISLASSLARRESIQRQFNEAGIRFEFFDAIDGRKGPHPLFERQDVVLRKKLCGIPLLPGELGCFASHYLLWQRCVELNESIVVVEDDAELKDTFASALPHLTDLANKHGYVRLFENETTHRKRVLVEHWDDIGSDVVRYLKGPASTRAYLLHPSAAEKFLAHAARWYKPVDDYMDEFWISGVECKGLVPGIVNDETDFESEIKEQVVGYKERTLAAKIEREWLRFKSDLQRLIFNLRKSL
ncbi:glycosyltransferase family 25 protein [Aliagarivorans marinus]|uniref:glycosyltransferase family 25 protein n=1 Tax=Aliagarivorans marinus TaxID=561965 RepID=UPI00047D1D6F|nr:glycosyltransferase family 25 protein [Aliagarivorans marinus]